MKNSNLERKFTAFIVKSITGIVRDYYRRERKRMERETLYCTLTAATSTHEYIAPYVTTRVLLDMCDRTVCRQLSRLTSKQSFVLLHILNGYSETEIATMLNISQQGVHAVKVRAQSHFLKEV